MSPPSVAVNAHACFGTARDILGFILVLDLAPLAFFPLEVVVHDLGHALLLLLSLLSYLNLF